MFRIAVITLVAGVAYDQYFWAVITPALSKR